MTEKKSTDNPAKPFWSGMDYIKDSIGCFGSPEGSEGFAMHRKTITIPMEEWDAIVKNYGSLEKAIANALISAIQIFNDLDERKWLNEESVAINRSACRNQALGIVQELARFVNNEKTEVKCP
jgi:hypothetical protein